MKFAAEYDTFTAFFFHFFYIAMNTLNTQSLENVAKLAKLALNEQQLNALGGDLNKIFELFSALNKEEISALAPLAHPLEAKQRLRADVSVQKDMHPALEENAPDLEDGFILVPKVIE